MPVLKGINFKDGKLEKFTVSEYPLELTVKSIVDFVENLGKIEIKDEL